MVGGWDPDQDPVSTSGFDTCDRVLELVGDRGEALVSRSRGRRALTRFANSRIHQNVDGEVEHVRLQVVVDGGRCAQATTTRSDPEGLSRLVEGAIAAARLLPADPGFPGLAAPAPLAEVDHFDAATASATPDDRAAVVADWVASGAQLESAGYCSTSGEVHVMRSTAGLRCASRVSMAQVDAIHRAVGEGGLVDGFAQITSARVGEVDGRRAGEQAARKARDGRDPISLEPGSYEVVLEPRAVAAILLFPAWLGFNGKAHTEGMSFAHLGEVQFDSCIDLWDDATDPRSLGRAYDAEGTPKRRLDLVRGGVTVGLAHDRRSAAVAGVESTGSSVGSDAFGGYPGDLFLGEGSSSREELIAGVDRGLLVSDFWYNRILDPKTQVVTGLTRNGLFLIENGAVVAPVQNLRFTQSVVAGLGPNRVLGLGNDGELVSNEGGVVHVPSMSLASWSFTGNAQG